MPSTAQDLRVESAGHLWDWFAPAWGTLSAAQRKAWVLTFSDSYKKSYRPDQVDSEFGESGRRGLLRWSGKPVASNAMAVKARYTPARVLETMASTPGQSREATVVATAETFIHARYLRRADLNGVDLLKVWRKIPDRLRAELLENEAVTADSSVVAEARKLLLRGDKYSILAEPLFFRGFAGDERDSAYVAELLTVAARSVHSTQGERFARLVVASPHISMEQVELFHAFKFAKYARSDANLDEGFGFLVGFQQGQNRRNRGNKQDWVSVDFDSLLSLSSHLFANPTLTADQRTKVTSHLFDSITGHRPVGASSKWSTRDFSPHSILLPSLMVAGSSSTQLADYFKSLSLGSGFSLLDEGYSSASSTIEDYLDAFPEETLRFLKDNYGEHSGLVSALNDPDVTVGQVDALSGGNPYDRWRWVADNLKVFSFPLVAAAIEQLGLDEGVVHPGGFLDEEMVGRPSLMSEFLSPSQAVKAVNDVVCWQLYRSSLEEIAEKMGVDPEDIPHEWLALMA